MNRLVSQGAWHILPMTRRHARAFHGLIDAIAKEGEFLSFVQAPPLRDTKRWVHGTLKARNPFFIMLAHEELIGWCDVRRSDRDTQHHVGVLGIGLSQRYRGRGLGQQLLLHTLTACWAEQFIRIELAVRQSNQAAIRLYEYVGFETEGIHRAAARVGDSFYDVRVMALLRPGFQPASRTP